MTGFPGRAISSVVPDASHALFPEQPAAVREAMLPWIVGQAVKLKT
jgi:hypothetical protein